MGKQLYLFNHDQSRLTNVDTALAAFSAVSSVVSEEAARRTAAASSEVCLVEVVTERMAAAAAFLVVVAARVVEVCWDSELSTIRNV